MDSSLLLPKLKLTTLSLLLFNTFCPLSFAFSDHENPDFLPTEGTQVRLPFLNLLEESFHSNYAGDSFLMPNNTALAHLLDKGVLSCLHGNCHLWPKGGKPAPLDGWRPDNFWWNLEYYSMKFVVYDIRLRKLQINALDMSFSLQLQIFLQWEEWITKDTQEMFVSNPKRACVYACDSTQPTDLCCDHLWVPKLRFPNTDVTRMNSILSNGNLGASVPLTPDIVPLGWRITNVIVSPLCDVASWKPTFLALDKFLFPTISESQSQDIEISLNKGCPKLYSWSQSDLANSTPISMYQSIRDYYSQRLYYTQNAYIKCVTEHGFVYKGNERNYIYFWINVSDPRFHNKVSLPCLVDAVRNLTTPGIKVTILVKRYTMYYILKLVIPTIVCVGFAFTTVAINVNGVANRLMVVVPAAIALSTLQATVVATDLPVVSYIVPSTWLVMLSYIIQLLICLESMVVYKLGYSKFGKRNAHFKCPFQFKWTTRRIDFLLMGMLFILYMVIVSVCMLIPATNMHQTLLSSNGISVWNGVNNTV